MASDVPQKRTGRNLLIPRLRERRFSLIALAKASALSCVLSVVVYHAFHVGFESPSRMYVRSLNALLPDGYCPLPHDQPDGGMEHSFALYYMLKKI